MTTVIKPPSSTKIHEIVNHSNLYQKILLRYGLPANESHDKIPHLKVFCPITDKQICNLRADHVEKVSQKIENAENCFKNHWSVKTALERANLLTKYAKVIEHHRQELAEIMSIENGKNVREAFAEIGVGPAACNWFAGEIRRSGGEVIPNIHKDHTVMTFKQPVGPTAMITPWNFPSAMVTRKAFAAIAAGCSVVLKPASETPLSALALVILAEEAGLPKGVLECVLSCSKNQGDFAQNFHSTAVIGEKLFTDPRIKAVSFTGSTSVGKKLMSLATQTVKKNCMELGGNAPFIVFNSANVQQAVDNLIAGKFRNNGQVCIAPNRILVQSDIYKQFLAQLLITMQEKLKFGVPEDPETTVGPMIYERAIPGLKKILNDSISKGAQILLGGHPRTDLGPCFFEPTILADCNNEMMGFSEEVFGPIVSVGQFQTEEQALQMANQGTHGLAAYLYSNEAAQIFRCSKAIETGMLGVNTVAISTIEYPFGGVRESGLGREGSKFGMDSYTEVKMVNWNWS